MIDLDNQTDLEIDLKILETIANELTDATVELLIVDDTTMTSLNSEHREKEHSTDVLSFPLEAPFTQQPIFGMPLGSIVISDSFVKEKAAQLGHTLQDETALLFIHGMLHLLGFDHEKDKGQMRDKEKQIIQKFDLPQSLIVRTEEY